MKYLIIIVGVVTFFGCRKNELRHVPDCIRAKIEFLKSQPKGDPAYSVYQYDFNGHKLYYFPPQCCDQYSELYDANCNLICHPDGGITGGGDGRCGNISDSMTNEVLIWKDPRQ